MVCSTELASRSEKNFCLRIRSSSSPPRISSVTMNTCLPLSYTWDTNGRQTGSPHVKVNASPTAGKEKKSPTHVLQCYDVGVLSVSEQNLNLLRRICAGFVDHLQSQKAAVCCTLIVLFFDFSLHDKSSRPFIPWQRIQCWWLCGHIAYRRRRSPCRCPPSARTRRWTEGSFHAAAAGEVNTIRKHADLSELMRIVLDLYYYFLGG